MSDGFSRIHKKFIRQISNYVWLCTFGGVCPFQMAENYVMLIPENEKRGMSDEKILYRSGKVPQSDFGIVYCGGNRRIHLPRWRWM